MSLKLVGQVSEIKLPRSEKEVLRALCDAAEEVPGYPGVGINCCPSIYKVAWISDYSEREVQRSLRNLEKGKGNGPIAEPKGVHPIYGTTDYELHLERAPRKPSFEPKRRGRPGRLFTEKIGVATSPQGDSTSPNSKKMGDATSPQGDATSPNGGDEKSPQGATMSPEGDAMTPYPVLLLIEGNTEEENGRPAVLKPASKTTSRRKPPTPDELLQIWAPIERELRQNIEYETFARFYSPLKLIDRTYKSLIVSAPDWTLATVGEQRLRAQIEHYAQETQMLRDRKIEIVSQQQGGSL